MATTTISRPAASLGRGVALAAAAGLLGLAITIAAAAATVFNPAVVRTDLVPGYQDYGLRHSQPAVAPFEMTHSDVNRADDYGLRCQVSGWCPVPASNGHR
jgi:hypothetical protein